jgi:PAS domain S-box-containing protein
VLSAGITAIGYDQYRRQEREIRAHQRNGLGAIADLKVRQIAQWRGQLLAQARVISEHSEMFPTLGRALRGSLGPAESAALARWMGALASEAGYANVALLDAQGGVRFSLVPGVAGPHTAALVAEAVNTGKIVVADLHRSSGYPAIHMQLVFPIFPAAAGSRPIGAFVAWLDPRAVLYPLIQSWPTPSRTAETLLVRREGDQIVYLNELRHRKDTALNLRLPLVAGSSLPAAMAVAGQEGIIDGLDYRGVSVLAAARRIPDSPWYLVAKIDSEEVFADLRARAALLAAAVAALIALVGAGVALLWRHQRANHYRQRYQAELERRALVGHFDYLSRYANDIILLANEKFEIVEANERAAICYGYSREELLGMDLRGLRDPSTMADFDAQWTAAGAGSIYETRHRRKDGSTFPVEISARIIQVDGREFRQAIVRDITERKLHEQDRETMLALLRLLNAPNETRELLSALTEFLQQLSGCDTVEIRLRALDTDYEIVPDSQDTQAGYESVASIPIISAGETIGLLQLNDRRKDHFSPDLISFLERAAGSIATALAQRKAQAALRESEEKFRAIADYTVDWENWVGPDGKLLWVNPAVEEHTGYTVAECQAMPDYPMCLIHEEDRDAVRAAIEEANRGGRGQNYEFRLVRKDGGLRWCSVSWRPICDSAGRSMGHRSSVRDITEHRRLEEQFRQSQKLESVGLLAGGVAHDFNNLLTVINGYGDLLLGRLKEGDPLRTTVSEICMAGQRAAELTQQLLAFSRKQVFEPKALNLNHLIGETQDMLQRLLGEDIELVMALDPALGAVMADRGSLHQVLMNLAVNARDAMSGGGRLIIETANVDLDQAYSATHSEVAPGAYVLLALTDTGAGMDDQTRQQIFEPFFTTKKGDKGTGLGLSTVYGIVRQLGGWIWVYSEPGLGTTFKIYLPRVEAAVVAEEVEAAAPATLRGRETVLVVEDHPEVRRLAVTVLTEYGYQVLEAEGGEQALELAERHAGPIDLLVTDVVMPRMTGKDLAGRLKQSRPSVKVLYMSGYTDNVIGHQGMLDAGVNFLPKPFVPVDLARKVRQVLGVAHPTGTILVVDDEEGIRNLFREVLESAGHQVAVARNGSEALAMARERRFDVVVTDLVMPEREGIETIQTLRKDHPGMKIVAVSGAFGGTMLKAARVLGANATMLKPVRPDDLLDTVRKMLQ